MCIHGMIIIEDSVLAMVPSFGWVTVSLKYKLQVMSCFMHNANCVSHYTIPVAFKAIPVKRDNGNLLLSGTVHIHAQLVLLYKL